MKKRLIVTVILIVYIAVLVKLMVFKEMPFIRIGHLMFNFGGAHEGAANLIPFKTILPYLLGEKGFLIAFINLAGNIVLLVPIGFLVPFVYRNMTGKKTLILALAAGLTIEGLQEALRVGIFDIDDVILNGLGVMVGYWAFIKFVKQRLSVKAKRILVAGAIVTLAATSFFAAAVFRKPQLPDRLDSSAVSEPSFAVEKEQSAIQKGKDPCGSTGGTGQIVSLGKNTITIKLNDGVNQIINLTDQTIFRNSAGPISASGLKIDDRVTVVVMPDQEGIEAARVVLVCGGSNPELGK